MQGHGLYALDVCGLQGFGWYLKDGIVCVSDVSVRVVACKTFKIK